MRRFLLAPFAVVSAVVVALAAACPADRRAEGEGEGEGEEPDGPILSEVSCQGGDWVEIKSNATAPLDLNGWFVTDDLTRAERREPLFGTLDPKARQVFDVAAFGISCTDTITLLQGGRVQDSTSVAVVVEGASWARLPEPVDAASVFGEAFPTRGQPNQARVIGGVRLNEVDCRGVERVEIINTGAEAVDISGFVLAIDPAFAAGRFVIPAGVNIAANEYFIVEEQQGAGLGFDFDIDCNNGLLVLVNNNGVIVDSTVTNGDQRDELPEAFTWGRFPDGVGPFQFTEPTLDEPNLAPIELGAGVFDPSRLANVVVAVDPAHQAALLASPSQAVPCTFSFDADVAVAATVQALRPDVFSLSFAPIARFRGLEELQLDLSGSDPSLARAVVGGALFRAANIPAARVGLASVDVAGVQRPAALVVEVVRGRALRRIFPSTKHVYDSGSGPLDLLSANVAGYSISVGDDVRDDLQAVVDALLPFRSGPGFRQGADATLRVSETLQFLAIDAWLSNTTGYARAKAQHRVHVDDDGQARLLPAELSGILLDDGALSPPGSLLVDACLVDVAADCQLPFNELVVQADALAADLDLQGLVDVVETALAANANVDALAALRLRLQSRAAEVAARLPAP